MLPYCQCVKSVRIRSYSGPYSVRMWENANQNNSEYGHFSCSAYICRLVALTHFPRINANIQCPSTLICFVCSWDDEIPPDEVFWETTPDYFGIIPLKSLYILIFSGLPFWRNCFLSITLSPLLAFVIILFLLGRGLSVSRPYFFDFIGSCNEFCLGVQCELWISFTGIN